MKGALHFCFWVLISLAFKAVHSQENDNNKCQWVCDQKCVNTGDSYNCHCEIGWTLEDDGHSCKPENGEALLIFSTGTSIEGYRLESMINFTIAKNLQHVLGVSLGAEYTYWSDGVEKTISRSLNNGTKREVIITAGVDTPDDIAVDWITGNIYFTDVKYKWIGVCNDNGYFCKVLINDTDKPRGIALIPSRGKMYWTDWGDKPHIAMSSMDGSKKELFVKDNLAWPNDLTIDHPSNRIYWVDGKLGKIECINLDGTDRRTVLEGVAKHPFSIAVFGNRLYWSDWNTSSIHSCNKFTGQNFTTPVQLDKKPYGIHIYHSNLNAKQDNPCALTPCSQLCLLAENQTYNCACTAGTELGMDRHTCRDSTKRKFVVVAAGNAIAIYYHTVIGRPINVIPNVKAHYFNAMTYDPLKDTLIAVDQVAHSIFRYDLKSNQTDPLKFTISKDIKCIVFDYLGNNLYMSMDKKIEVHSFNTDEKTEFSYPDSPLDMVLIPEEGMMFVVFRSYDSFHIDRVQMNGLGSREPLVEEGLYGPKISLAYYKPENKIFWADEGADSITSSDLYGKNRRLFRFGIISPVSIAVSDTEIFWTFRPSANLSSTDKKAVVEDTKTLSIAVRHSDLIGFGQEIRNFFLEDIGQQVDAPLLQTIYGFYIRGMHPCSLNNGGCSHVCLVTDANNRLCACPLDIVLDSDMKTCKTKTSRHTNEINSSCSNGHFWIGLFVGLFVFITFSAILYYIKPNCIIMTHSRNRFSDLLARRQSYNIASLSTSTIETL